MLRYFEVICIIVHCLFIIVIIFLLVKSSQINIYLLAQQILLFLGKDSDADTEKASGDVVCVNTTTTNNNNGGGGTGNSGVGDSASVGGNASNSTNSQHVSTVSIGNEGGNIATNAPPTNAYDHVHPRKRKLRQRTLQVSYN